MFAVSITHQAKKTMALPSLERVSLNSFFLILFSFQLLFIFQGLDFVDEGFHSTFYQQIFNEPRSVEYNFMFYLSGIIGGAWLRLFPEYGLLGLRLGGVIVNMLAIIVTYKLLKDFIQERYLRLGLLLLVLLNGPAAKDLNYNNISALFFISAILFLFLGIKNDKGSKFFIAGVLLSLAAFSRLSNIVGLSLIAVIVFSGFYVIRTSVTCQIKQSLFLVSGFFVSAATILGIMKMIGHYDIFIDSLKLLKDIAGSSENSHGMSKIVKTLFRDYSTAIFKRALPVFILVFLGAALVNYCRDNKRLTGIIKSCFSAAFILLLLVLVIFKGTLPVWIFIVLLFAAMSFIAAFFITLKRNEHDLRIISLAGTIMTISLVAGSDYGIPSSGTTALWIGMPIATEFFFKIFSISVKSSIASRDNINTKMLPGVINLSVTDKQLQNIWQWGIYSCVILLLLHSFSYTNTDNSNKFKMRYPVHNAFLTGVFTSQERSEAVDELLTESSRYIRQNDYVIAYEAIPMFYTLTKTRPFIRNSWPCLYDKATLDAELSRSLAETHILPVIVYQKVQTVPGPLWPDASQDNSALDMDKPQNEPIKKFISANNYQLVWENIAFKIYIARQMQEKISTSFQRK